MALCVRSAAISVRTWCRIGRPMPRRAHPDHPRRRCAIMCAEAVWWRCHRRIIADYLIAVGGSVFHILGPASCAIRTCAARRPTPLWRVARASREAISARTISCVSMTSTDADNASVDSTSPAEHKQLELLINPRFILQFLQSMRAFVFICNLAITGGHDKTWGHQCQKKNWGSGYFAGPFTAHDFFGSGRQFEEGGAQRGCPRFC